MSKEPNVKPIPEGMTEQSLKANLSSRASTLLKQKHLREYEAIAQELYSEYGLTYVRKLSPLERKRLALERLAAELGVTVVSQEV